MHESTGPTIEQLARAIDGALGADDPGEVTGRVLETLREATGKAAPTRDEIMEIVNAALGEGFDPDETLDELSLITAAIDAVFTKGGAR